MNTSLIRRAACICSAAAMATMAAHSVAADTTNPVILAQSGTIDVPPADFAGKRWTAENGCQYSRAGRPGEAVWYLIINSSGGKECRRVIASKVYDDGAYQGYKS